MALMNPRTLPDILDAEAALITAGNATACAAPTPSADITDCARTSTHTTDGELARESHAGRQHLDPDDPNSPTHWITWTD